MPSPPAPASRWTAYCQPRDEATMRLFCFPYAGGGASVYRGWARALPPNIDVCPVQYPGRETRIQEPPYTALVDIVHEAAIGLLPLLDRPFCFFGHSMGALVAFELARLLQREGGPLPQRLFVSAFSSPLLPYHPALPYDLPTEEFTRRLRELDGTPKEALDSPELMAFILPILRADCQVCDQYRLTDPSPLACPITAYGGINDPEAQENAMAQWRGLTQGDFEVQMFPGGHFYLQSAREKLLNALDGALRKLT